jgi:hypothetical protein
LPPFEDRGSGFHFAILSRHQPATLKFATHPFGLGIDSRVPLDRSRGQRETVQEMPD